MICDICKKNPAVIHIQQIGPDGKHTLSLCMKCALTRFSDTGEHSPHELDKLLQSLTSPKGALEAISKFGMGPDGLSEFLGEASSQTKCPTCGSTWRDISHDRQLGCEKCLETFRDQIYDVLNPSQRDIRNALDDKFVLKEDDFDSTEEDLENAVKDRDLQMEIAKLKRELDCAIKDENYARAARLRDLIAEFTPQTSNEQSE